MTATRLPFRRWSVDDFDRMCEAGILSPRGYELLDGVIYTANGVQRRFSLRDLDRMVDAGILTWEERADLVDGYVFGPPPALRVHRSVLIRLNSLLHRLAPGGIVSPVGYVVLDDENTVAPDLAILRGREDFYMDRWPVAEDVELVIEVAQPLSIYERGAKRDLYARFGLPEYWVVDTGSWTVVVHCSPEDGRYTDQREYRRGDSFDSFALGGREVRVEDVLGSAAN